MLKNNEGFPLDRRAPTTEYTPEVRGTTGVSTEDAKKGKGKDHPQKGKWAICYLGEKSNEQCGADGEPDTGWESQW
jgi:hypothetical protein